MNRYKILDYIRGIRSVEYASEILKLWESADVHDWAIQRQKDNLICFLMNLRGNEFFSKYLKDVCDDEIKKDPYHVMLSLPVTDKTVIRTHFEEIHNKAYRGEKAYTGGSTGSPFHYIVGKDLLTKTIGFTQASWIRFGGYHYSDNVLVIGGTSIGGSESLKRKLLHFLQRRKFISGGIVNKENAVLIAQHINTATRPIIIYGYPSSISQYIKIFNEDNIQIDRSKIKTILVTSETMFDDRKKFIESYFNHDVINLYGARDSGISSVSTDNKVFYYNGMDCYVENIEFDGQKELVVTNLHNHVFPFARYRIGDIASVELRKEGYPFILKDLIGRTRDFISLPDGKKIHGSMLNKVFKQCDITEYQIEQYEDLHCVVRLERRNCVDIEQQTAELSNVLQKILENVKLDIQMVPRIKRAENSKLRNIISHTI